MTRVFICQLMFYFMVVGDLSKEVEGCLRTGDQQRIRNEDKNDVYCGLTAKEGAVVNCDYLGKIEQIIYEVVTREKHTLEIISTEEHCMNPNRCIRKVNS